MKQGKLSSFLERVNLRLAAGKEEKSTGKKRLIGAVTVGALVGAVLIGSGIYNRATRTMVEETNRTMMGNDYMDWVRTQIGSATAEGMAAYVHAEEQDQAEAKESRGDRQLSDLINYSDIEGISSMILTEIDRRYAKTGEAFSAGQKDQLTRLVRSELNNSIESAMTSLLEQNREKLTEETYHYVAEYVTKNMDSVLRTASVNEAAIEALQKDSALTSEKLSALSKETGAYGEKIDNLMLRQTEEEAYVKTTNNRVASLESDTVAQNRKIEEAKTELENAKQELHTAAGSINDLKQELTTTKKEFGSADGKLAALESNINYFQSSLKTSNGVNLKEAYGMLSNSCAELQRRAAELESRILEKETTLRELSKELSNEKTRLQDAKTELEGRLSDQQELLESQKEQLTAQLEDMKTQKETLDTQKETLEAQKETLEGLKEEYAALKAENEEMLGNMQGLSSSKVEFLTEDQYKALTPEEDVLYVITG